MYLNFGDIGSNMKALMDDFQRSAKSNKKLESISDMKVSNVLINMCGHSQ